MSPGRHSSAPAAGGDRPPGDDQRGQRRPAGGRRATTGSAGGGRLGRRATTGSAGRHRGRLGLRPGCTAGGNPSRRPGPAGGAILGPESAAVSQKPAYPRSAASHEVTANSVLELHARRSGWVRSLPVPIDAIVRQTYGLRVLWDDIPETRGERILGMLEPKAGIIALNRRHEDMLSEVVGPQRFTLAHELAHWLYDADRDSQLFDHPVFCRRLADADPRQAREINANRLAAALLMPSGAVRQALGLYQATPSSRSRRTLEPSAMNAMARAWGVSRQAFRIRLEGLGLGWCLPRERGSAGNGPGGPRGGRAGL
ncbi:MAG TPA: ImmA/IrrE family metallo-endopeptidase [Acidimicrobiales bacterium]|jgi:Zn-dependent peptidase ImmA (M78 family)|nr:ImmA/IrrE family metallo-endopeptidase [Acidimicrobiales bacterium]